MMKVNQHFAVCLMLLAASIIIGWKPIIETFALSWQNNDYTHVLLILPICTVLILLERKHLQRTREWDFQLGPLILAAAVAIAFSAWFWSPAFSADEQLAMQMFALVLSWIGIFVICFGQPSCGRLLFPLLFLFGLVPLPRFALDFMIAFLQQGSVWSTHAFFALFDVPTAQHGIQLTIPGLTIDVAPACSSIRSSSMLVVTTMLLAHVILRSTWRKSLIVALSIPLSIAKNGLRIFTIAMLGTRVDPAYLTGRLHHQGGILFFLAALIIEIFMILLLRRQEEPIVVRDLQPLPSSAATD